MHHLPNTQLAIACCVPTKWPNPAIGGKPPPFPFHFCIKNGQFWTLDPLFDVPKGEKFGVPKPQLGSIIGGDWGDRCSTSVHDAMPQAWVHCMQAKKDGMLGAPIGVGMAIACLEFSKFGKSKKSVGKIQALGARMGHF